MPDFRTILLLSAACLCIGAARKPAINKQANAAVECGLNNLKTYALLKTLKPLKSKTQTYDSGAIQKEIVTSTVHDLNPAIVRPFGFAAKGFQIEESVTTRRSQPNTVVEVTVDGSFVAVRAAILKRLGKTACRSDDLESRLCRVDMGAEKYSQSIRLTQFQDKGVWGPLFLKCEPDS